MQPLSVSRDRIYSIDVLRGLVMILMALDHVRDFFHQPAMTEDPLNVDTTFPLLYITRWITHFCAPVFVFLSGLSVCLMQERKTTKQISGFLLKRGLWLILVEITLVSFALSFNPMMNVMILQVIWAIGICFVCLSLLVFLPWQAILGLGVLIICSHNLLDYIEAKPGFQPGLGWQLLHQTRYTFFEYLPGHGFIVIYPFLPWLGIMLAGYGLGRIFRPDVSAAQRKRILVVAGISMIAVFIAVRLLNGYGDPGTWETHPHWVATLGDFMNVQKYPPSLLYTCATIGPALLLLAWMEGRKSAAMDVAKVYGSVPFFYYILHFYIIHLLCVILFFASGYGADDIVSPQTLFLFRPPTFGYPLWVAYLIWIGIVALLYPLCKRYAAYKRTHRHWWLSYL
ncbi:DUF1624 domain-containing protein [Chitinophaga sp. XS-30]|uniref:DUF1624 domain-containing protein n=1 Tax=Chitinophaga sp. XS-30 TaxID=2604421 RepID=UPI0011DD2EA6|nr:heparan-alpha-glucosaminide N-acetyltransferase domain-containing protein [Chitinophaga sp. XS-30]QEH42641.1 DUF1624 domain-containing protein [Chitinophaga sp. XS-30]